MNLESDLSAFCWSRSTSFLGILLLTILSHKCFFIPHHCSWSQRFWRIVFEQMFRWALYISECMRPVSNWQLKEFCASRKHCGEDLTHSFQCNHEYMRTYSDCRDILTTHPTAGPMKRLTFGMQLMRHICLITNMFFNFVVSMVWIPLTKFGTQLC